MPDTIPTGAEREDLPNAIGRFEVLRLLGRGGMGKVYLVRDPATGEEVALKLLREADNPHGRLRFRREFRAASRLNHPQIVRVCERGHAGGQDYFTMEYVRGVDLLRAKKEQTASLSAGERLRWIIGMAGQIVHALSYLHGRRVIHRDLKPENILVDDKGRAKVMDFGLARGLDQESVVLTQAGAVFGSALYMSPEQAKGLPADARSDLYSLGIILFELFSGRPPLMGPSVPAILYKHIHEIPPRLASVRPDVPQSLSSLVADLLAKDPADRPHSAAVVGTLLLQVSLTESAEVASETVEMSAGPAELARPRLIGRAHAMETISRLVDALVDGNGGLVRCLGPAGAGKTRILEELRGAFSQRGVLVAATRIGDLPRRPFAAGAALISQIADEMETTPTLRTEAAVSAAHQLTRLAPEAMRIAGAAVGTHPDPAPAEQAAGITAELVAACAQDRPLLWIVDDAHLLDEVSGATVEAIARLRSRLPILLVLGWRSDETTAPERTGRLLRWVAALPTAGVLELPALDREGIVALARSMLAAPPPEELVEQLVEESRGNPRDVEETIWALFESGTLRRIGGHWELLASQRRGSSSTSTVPEAVASHWGLRLESLEEDVRLVLTYVAILGRRVGFDELRQVSGLPEDSLLDLVDELLREKLLKTHGTAEQHREEYALVNERVRDVALARLSPARRASLHRRAAEAIALYSSSEERVFDLATHFDAAGDVDQARAHHLSAAVLARKRGAHLEAAQHLERARDLGADDPKLEMQIIEALVSAGDGAGAATRARVAADREGASPARAHARYLLARGLSLVGRYSEAARAYLEALSDLGRPISGGELRLRVEIVWRFLLVFFFYAFLPRRIREPAPDSARTEELVYRHATTGFYMTRIPAQRFVFGVLELRFASRTRIENREELAEVFLRQAHTAVHLFGPRNLHTRLALWRARRAIRHASDRAVRARFGVFHGHLLVLQGALLEARETALAATEEAERAGDPALALLASAAAIQSTLLAGDARGSRILIERAKDYLLLVPDRAMDETIGCCEMTWQFISGREREGRALMTALTSTDHPGRSSVTRALLALQESELARRTGDVDLAIRRCSAAHDACVETGLGWFYDGMFRLMRATLLAHKGRTDKSALKAARREARNVPRAARRHTVYGGWYRRALGSIALAEGRPARALRLAQAARRRSERAPTAMEAAFALELEAEAALLLGDATAAEAARTKLVRLCADRGLDPAFFRTP